MVHNVKFFSQCNQGIGQGLSQDLETGYTKMAIIKNLIPIFFNGDHNRLKLEP